jgi:hypothetical protein
MMSQHNKQAPETPPSPRQSILARRRQNRSLKVKLSELKSQRDQLASLLVEADAKIFDLTIENSRLRAFLPPSKVTLMPGRTPRFPTARTSR